MNNGERRFRGRRGGHKCSKVRTSRLRGTRSSSVLARPSHRSCRLHSIKVNYHPSAQDALRPLQTTTHCVCRESKLILMFANQRRQIDSTLSEGLGRRGRAAAIGNDVLLRLSCDSDGSQCPLSLHWASSSRAADTA